MFGNYVVIKGAGDLATGTAHRLARCGFPVVMLEVPNPTVIRRTVAFAEAVFEQEISVEGVTARLADSPQEIKAITESGDVAIFVDPRWTAIPILKPFAVIDAIIAKTNLGTSLTEAPVVIGLGPGFIGGIDVHAVVETLRGHDLGRVLLAGSAAPNTGIPGEIGGYGAERVVRSPAVGIFRGLRVIGDTVKAGDIIATVDDVPVHVSIAGVLRGMLRNGISVTQGFKIADVDPRCAREHCFSISDKARSVAGGVLEALLHLLNKGEVLWMPNLKQHSRPSVQTK